jgi:hypothetical protein
MWLNNIFSPSRLLRLRFVLGVYSARPYNQKMLAVSFQWKAAATSAIITARHSHLPDSTGTRGSTVNNLLPEPVVASVCSWLIASLKHAALRLRVTDGSEALATGGTFSHLLEGGAFSSLALVWFSSAAEARDSTA